MDNLEDIDDEDENLHSIGFMFDAYHEKIVSTVTITSEITIKLKTIGDQPGHKQSGQYLWPAARALSIYISKNWIELTSSMIIELGAGCGLSGLTSAFLSGVKEVIFTDYDYGTLTLIEDSIKLNSPPCKTTVSFLEWGKANEILHTFHGNLIIGSDLIYSKDVVKPLLSTVKLILQEQCINEDSKFILATSFSLGEVKTFYIFTLVIYSIIILIFYFLSLFLLQDIEALIDATCFELKLNRIQIYSLHDTTYNCKIEHFKLS